MDACAALTDNGKTTLMRLRSSLEELLLPNTTNLRYTSLT